MNSTASNKLPRERRDTTWLELLGSLTHADERRAVRVVVSLVERGCVRAPNGAVYVLAPERGRRATPQPSRAPGCGGTTRR